MSAPVKQQQDKQQAAERAAKKPFRPYGAALTAWKSRRREILLCGPGDTGKSRAILEKLHYCADKYPRLRGLIVRKTRSSLSQSAMVTFEQKVLPEGWLGNLIRFNTTDQQYEYPNGSIIAVGGMDNAEKVLSSEWDFIYPQEATELTENDWEILTMRLRNGVMPYQQILGDCNPSYPTHWLKSRCDRGVTLLLTSRHEDNPSITEARLDVLRSLTGVRRLRLYLGQWVAAEGMVYESWDRAVHLVSLQQLMDWQILYPNEMLNPKGVRRVIAGVDWGWTNPGVIQVWAIDADGRIYQIHEVYQTQRDDDWWVEQARTLKAKYKIEVFVCDPSEPAYIAKFNAAHLNAVEAINDIKPGIAAMQSRLKIAGDGRPRLYIYEHALKERDETRVTLRQPFCTEGEINEYVWPKEKDGQPVKEVPVKTNDHAMDCARYTCMWLNDPTPTAESHIEAIQRRVALSRQHTAVPVQGGWRP
jgi:phage terminase large subunit